jgi:hypothetical protein
MPWLTTNAEGCCQRLENASGAIGAPVFGMEKVSICLISRGAVAICAAKRVAVS